MSDRDVVLVAAARTPFGSFGGALRDYRVPELGALAVVEVLRRAGVHPAEVDELALGVNLPGSDRSIARQVLLEAGIPDSRVAYTVDRACCSSLTAITSATRSLRTGESEVAIAGGAENMSRVPYFLEDMRWGHRLGEVKLSDQLVISCPYTHVPRAVQAANEAARFAVDRNQQDAWALRSQQRYAEADGAGRFDEERFPIDLASGPRAGSRLEGDESPRPSTTLADLQRLPTVYGSTTVTAGNAPGLSSGSTALLLTTRGRANERGQRVLAEVIATAMVSGHPDNIASIPAVAATKVLERARRRLEEVDLIEINEAFAAVPLVSTLVLAGGDAGAAGRLREKVNVNGGAIAVGHPTGATGARLVMTLTNELRRRGGGLGMVAICGGIGEGEAVLLRVDG